ncbi:MAG: hypothetical protein ALECFALPRED_003679 [Alectoria fallacina]|uniref:Centromere protein H C-terminal domain-containing protein n=1 Tax=Alectoria fallacina TaxID=1903189 RepID=A0A8H3ITL3_9LECA|nr:MAG: hypothetical protein ALECFALPRED_003679 [Alectoria fallacina]
MSFSTDAAFADLAAQGPGDALPFYEIEGQILELWDQLNELRLEKALLEAQDTVPTGNMSAWVPNAMADLHLPVQQPSTDEELNAQLKIAEKECLEARATYSLKQSVVEDVLIVDPVLKAVHSGLKATRTERALHPLVDRRDTLEISHTNLSSTLQMLSKEAAMLSADNIRAMEKNRALTTTLVALAKKVQAQRDEATKDPRFSAQLDGLRNDAGTVRQRWRIMKSVVAAVIAGSGVDWAQDDTLRDLVLDEEDEAD